MTIATHKEMPGLIRKAKKVIVYTPIGDNTALHLMAVKKDVLEQFQTIAENKEWPDLFCYSISEGGWLYINGTIANR